MNLRSFITVLLTTFGTVCSYAGGVFEWGELAAVPDRVGFAAPFAGTSEGALIVAGGANFPDKTVWEGGAKVWHDRIFILQTPTGTWSLAGTMPAPRAYGVSVTIPEGVLCIGGSNEQGATAEVLLMRRVGDTVETESWPSLPAPLHFACGALVGRIVYVAGGLHGDSASPIREFLALDLDAPTASREWKKLEPWPGKPRMLATAGSLGGEFYLFSGLDLVPGTDGQLARDYLPDSWRFTPGQGWTRLADIPVAMQASPSPAPTLGSSHLFVFGGDDGKYFKTTGELQDRHPGFPPAVYGFHTITDAWAEMDQLPRDLGPDPVGDPNAGIWPPIVAPVVAWHGGWAIINGEVRPGARTPRVLFATPLIGRTNLGWLNTTTLSLYLAAMLGIGIWFMRRERNTEAFFRGGQRVPWWAAGMSIYATMLSALTFMALPAKVYATDWAYIFGTISLLLVTPLVTAVYLPFYRRLNVTSAYEYLEHRFSGAVRLLGSATFILFQLGRMAIVLYLPAVALSTVSSMDVYTCILIAGVLCIAYTMMGGIEAVIWTDVVQTVVLLGGAIISLVLIVGACQGGMGTLMQIALEQDKFLGETVWWSSDLSQATVIVILLGTCCNSLLSYTASQDVVQRYLTTSSEKMARRAIWTNFAFTIPAAVIFYGLGTALFVFYRLHPGRLDPTIATDAIFPLFIVRELPAGVAGLVIAGIFAASQSTLSSSLNSVATAWVTDFHPRFLPHTSDRFRLRLAQGIILGVGLVVTGVACLMAGSSIGSLMDAYTGVIGLAGGGLAGLFILGIFTRRANAAGALIGAVASLIGMIWIQRTTELSFFLYGALGIALCVGIGYVVSLAYPSAPKALAGLTWRDQTREG